MIGRGMGFPVFSLSHLRRMGEGIPPCLTFGRSRSRLVYQATVDQRPTLERHLQGAIDSHPPRVPTRVPSAVYGEHWATRWSAHRDLDSIVIRQRPYRPEDGPGRPTRLGEGAKETLERFGFATPLNCCSPSSSSATRTWPPPSPGPQRLVGRRMARKGQALRGWPCADPIAGAWSRISSAWPEERFVQVLMLAMGEHPLGK